MSSRNPSTVRKVKKINLLNKHINDGEGKKIVSP